MGDFIFCLIAILFLLAIIFALLGMVFDDRFDEEKMFKLAAGSLVLALILIVLIFLVGAIESLLLSIMGG